MKNRVRNLPSRFKELTVEYNKVKSVFPDNNRPKIILHNLEILQRIFFRAYFIENRIEKFPSV